MDDPLLPTSMGRNTKLFARIAGLIVLAFILATAISAVVIGSKDSVDSGFIGVSIALFFFLGTTLFLLKWMSDSSMEDKYRRLSMVQVVACLVACASLMAVMFTSDPTTYHLGGVIRGSRNISSPILVSLKDGPSFQVVANNECAAFQFPEPLEDGTQYSIAVSQPTDPSPPQTVTCTTTSGTGKIDGKSVIDVGISCRPILAFSISGEVDRLDGVLKLKNNNEEKTITRDGSFTFKTKVPSGSAYRVSVSEQPGSQKCSVDNGSGVVKDEDITNVAVICVRN